MICLKPSTPDLLRNCSNATFFPSEFFVPNSRARTSDINDKRTEIFSSEALLEYQQKISTSFPPHFPKIFIRFLCESIINVTKGNLTGVRKNQFVRFEKQLRNLTGKTTTLNSSEAELKIISYIY